MATRLISLKEIQAQLERCDLIRQQLGDQKKYMIQTFGCQQNTNDSEKLKGLLVRMGFHETEVKEEADLILINTCSVRENANDRFFGNLGNWKALKANKPSLIVGVCGCMMKQEEIVQKIRNSYPFVDLLFSPSDLYRFPELLLRRLQGQKKVYEVSDDDLVYEGVPVEHERKYRALVTIMYGCNNYCSFCIVPKTRGRERSRAQKDIVKEVKDLVAKGFSEVMLLGQNVNSYGKDLKQEDGQGLFVDLMEELARDTGIKRLRFMTPHPKDISSKLLDIMAKYPNIERHLHLPIQCGSDSLLKRMRRPYTVEKYMNIVREAKEKIPGLSITTDIIVGFPGETEEEFQGTLDVVKAVGYDSSFTFMYSPRPGTPAAKFENQIPQSMVSERFNRLIEVQNASCLARNQERVGRVGLVLVEGLSDHKSDMLSGRYSDGHLINFSVPSSILPVGVQPDSEAFTLWANEQEGKFLPVLVTQAKSFSLEGRYLTEEEVQNYEITL